MDQVDHKCQQKDNFLKNNFGLISQSNNRAVTVITCDIFLLLNNFKLDYNRIFILCKHMRYSIIRLCQVYTR